MWIYHTINAKPPMTGLGCLWGLGFGGRGREGGAERDRDTGGGV